MYKTKEELNEFMAKLFIENIWVFRGVDSGTEEFRHDFDLFKNYEDRGNQFKNSVRNL